MSLFSGKKRAQAAVELLTTYGWAIMGVILVIGVLSYFNVFDSKRFISERCDTGNQIQCLEAYANDGGEFQISLRNNYLVGIVIEGITVDGVPLEYRDQSPYSPIAAYAMNSGNVSGFGTPNMAGLVKNDKKTVNVIITFRRDVAGVSDCTEGMCYNVSGVATVKVQNSLNVDITH